MKYGGNILCIM